MISALGKSVFVVQIGIPLGAFLLLTLPMLVLGITGEGGSTPSAAPRAALNGDCVNASLTGFSTFFLFTNSSGLPVSGIRVTAGGFSQVTNSSGLAVLGGGNFTSFNVSYRGTNLQESVSGRQLPLICEGSSYYRIVSFSTYP